MTMVRQMFSITALLHPLSPCALTVVLQLLCTVNGTWKQRYFGTTPELSHRSTGCSEDICGTVKAKGKAHLKPPSATPG